MQVRDVPDTAGALSALSRLQSGTACNRVHCKDNFCFATGNGDFTVAGPDLVFADGFDSWR